METNAEVRTAAENGNREKGKFRKETGCSPLKMKKKKSVRIFTESFVNLRGVGRGHLNKIKRGRGCRPEGEEQERKGKKERFVFSPALTFRVFHHSHKKKMIGWVKLYLTDMEGGRGAKTLILKGLDLFPKGKLIKNRSVLHKKQRAPIYSEFHHERDSEEEASKRRGAQIALTQVEV